MRNVFWIAVGYFLAAPDSLLAQSDPLPEQRWDEEIIVTGERVARPSLETASSVAIFTSADVEATSADRLDQVLALVPNVQLGSGEEAPTIRGQDATGQLRNLFAFLGGARPRVTLQVDGRPATFYEFISGSQSTWDIGQVEIFRSPQTTTQGRNSIAGAIFVTTENPSFDWQAKGQLVVGSADMRQISGAISGPVIGDQLAFRVSGDLRLGEVTNEMTDRIDGADIDHDDFGTARIKLAYRPAGLAGASLATTFAYSRSQSPQFEGASPPFRERDLPIPNQMIGVMRVSSTSITTRAEYEIQPGLSSNITISYGDAKLQRFGLPGLGRASADTVDFSIEPTLLWNTEEPLSLLIGAHRYSMSQTQTIDISGFGLGIGTFHDDQDSLGLFGEATWRPAEFISLTGGLRYERDRQVRVGGIGRIGLDYDETFDAVLPKLQVAYHQDDDLTLGLMALRAFNPGGTSISLARAASDEFEAEYLWNYEAFLRARIADGSATLSANVFYSDIENAQRPQFVPIQLPNGVETQAVEFANAPAAHTYGAEAELGWKMTRNLHLSVGIGLLETKVHETLEDDDPTKGSSFQRAPRLSVSGSIDWSPLKELRISAQVRHQSGYFSDDANIEALRIAPSTIVDGRTSYDFGRVSLFAYARNLFDEFYLTYLFNPNFASTGKPREIGIGLAAEF